VDRFAAAEAARRAGVSAEFLSRLVEQGVIEPAPDGTFGAGEVRRATTLRTLTDTGIGLADLATVIRNGSLSLDFLDFPSYERFAALSSESFGAVAARTGVPIELLGAVREAFGGAEPAPTDLMRDDELSVVPFLELQLEQGFRAPAIERLMRATGDSLRRITESEGEWWYSEVITPRQGRGEDVNPDWTDRMAGLAEAAMLAMYHGQQNRAWMANIIRGVENQLADAGLYTRLDRPPAICFLDITGYTRLTQERGDHVAAELAEKLARLVQRTSVQHGGKPIKWLGDGVMFWFRDPGPAVVAALRMVEGVAAAGLPPAHVGVHSGPVLAQQGDYFGQTVNVAARIADFARPGEVLVSQAVVDAANEPAVSFTDIGPVELKGVQGATRLHSARLES
jgi:class 3 adenylate cyclase